MIKQHSIPFTSFLFALGLTSLLLLPWWASLALYLTMGLAILSTLISFKTMLRGLAEFMGFVCIMALLTTQILSLGIMLQ